jgi:hypothetical protein
MELQVDMFNITKESEYQRNFTKIAASFNHQRVSLYTFEICNGAVRYS